MPHSPDLLRVNYVACDAVKRQLDGNDIDCDINVEFRANYIAEL